ncbi:hypothetical protein ACHAWF_011507 [Thalassiosira exigua]
MINIGGTKCEALFRHVNTANIDVVEPLGAHMSLWSVPAPAWTIVQQVNEINRSFRRMDDAYSELFRLAGRADLVSRLPSFFETANQSKKIRYAAAKEAAEEADKKARAEARALARAAKEADKKARAEARAIARAATKEEWLEMFRLLQEYERIHGDCNVPGEYKANPKLAGWVSYQRQRKAGTGRAPSLNDEETQLLEDLGFAWVLNKQHKRDLVGEFMPIYEKLKVYKNEHGHCRVSYIKDKKKREQFPEEARLGTWVKNLRSSKKGGKLAQWMIDLLDKLGFEWSVGQGKGSRGGKRTGSGRK